MTSKSDKLLIGFVVAGAFAFVATVLAGVLLVGWRVVERRGWGRERSVRASPSSVEPSTPRPSSNGTSVDPGPAFPLSVRSENFVLYSDANIALEPLARIAETTRERARSWLGLGGPLDGSAPPVDVYLCRGVDTIYALEASRGWPTSNGPGRTFPFEGGCYAESNMIAVLVYDDDQPSALVAHEVAHLVFHELTGRDSSALDEGFACFVSDWMTRGADATPEEFARREDELMDLARAAELRTRGYPSVCDLLNLDYWTFRDARANGSNFALASNLTRELIGSEDPRILGRYAAFLRGFRTSASSWSAVGEQYDRRVLESLWQARIRRVARFGVAWGEWGEHAGTVSGRAIGDTSSALLWAGPSGARSGWRIAFTPDSDPVPTMSMGFTIGYQRPDDFTYVELMRDRGVCSILQRHQNGWITHATYELPSGFAFVGRRIELECDQLGRLTLSVDQRPVFVHGAGQTVLRGRVGLMVSQRDRKTPSGTLTEAAFRDVLVED